MQATIFDHRYVKTWAQAFNQRLPIHVYTRSLFACGAAKPGQIFRQKQEDLLGSGVYGDPGLTLAVKKIRW
jgi:phosphate transport system substrate-binding protein